MIDPLTPCCRQIMQHACIRSESTKHLFSHEIEVCTKKKCATNSHTTASADDDVVSYFCLVNRNRTSYMYIMRHIMHHDDITWHVEDYKNCTTNSHAQQQFLLLFHIFWFTIIIYLHKFTRISP
jgi:hypothetical protein